MIFYDHIKGCGNSAADKNGQWTWIQFKNGKGDWWDNPQNLSGLLCSPHIILKHGNNNTDPATYQKAIQDGHAEAIDLGNILTSNAPEQVMTQPLSYQAAVKIDNNGLSWADTSEFTYLGSADFRGIRFADALNSGDTTNTDFYFYHFPNAGLKLSTRDTKDIETWLFFDQAGKQITLGHSTIISGDLTVKDQVNALYFNATSDRRAKTNLKAADAAAALDIVNKLPIYTFNYKADKTNETSIGVLAQDAALFDGVISDDFSMVTNREATGKDGDYMQIKESKMVYVLWAAVQQQQKQINYLEKRIEQLEQQLKK